MYFGALIIELRENIPPSSLPGRLGGIVPYYSNGKPAWKNRSPPARLFSPVQGNIDVFNYAANGLTPDMRVSGERDAGTSGLVLVNRVTNDRRVMVPNHVFSDTDHVYHPTTAPQNLIGKVVQRYTDLDIALVQLHEGIEYKNRSYFDAPVPKKLVTEQYRGIPGQEWFFVDSPFTGLAPLLWGGARVRITEEPYHNLKYDKQYIFLSMGINVGQPTEGVCGSPIVHDECVSGSESDGAVLGLFSRSGQNFAQNLFVSVLDRIVADGWEVEA